jgi:hypothetical protein
MRFLSRARRCWTVRVLACGLASGFVAGCSGPAEPTGDGLVTYQLDPQSAVLAPGDVLPVRVNVVALVAQPQITVRFRTSGAVMARLDTTVGNGAPVMIRAATPGTDSVRATIQVNGDVVDTWLPVLVQHTP